MRTLVTGCAGFIGARVAEMLAAQGNEVVGLDSVNDAYDPRLKEWRLAQLERAGLVRIVRGDILDSPRLEALFAAERFDVVYNFAARAGVRQSILDPQIYLDANATGSLNLLEACRRHDVRRFLLASTSSLYGKHNERPFREDANTDLPLSPYAASKKAAEAMVATYSHLYGIDAAVPRFFTVYGPAGRPDMSVFRFVRWIAEGEPVHVLGDGKQERDYTYVDDVARGAILAGQKVRGFDIVNLGGDRPVSLWQIIGILESRLGTKANVEHGNASAADVRATWADISKAKRLLGWAPQVTLEEGLQRVVDWYQANRAWARQLDLGAVA